MRVIIIIIIFPAVPTSDIKDQFAFRTTGSTTSALIHFLVMLLGFWRPTSLLGAFFRLQQGFRHSLSRNITPKTGQFQLPTIRYYLAVLLADRTRFVGHSTSIQITRSIIRTWIGYPRACIMERVIWIDVE